MSLFRKNIIAGYSAQLVAVVCNFLCSILAARMLGAGGQGDLALYVNFSAFVTLLIGLGLPSGIVYFIASGKIAKHSILGLSLLSTLCLLTAFAVIFFIGNQFGGFSLFIPEFIIQSPGWSGILIGHLFLLMMNQYFAAVLNGENNFIKPGIANVTGSLLLLTLYAMHYYNIAGTSVKPIFWILMSLASAAFLQFLLYFIFVFGTHSAFRPFKRFNFMEMKPLILFSLIAYAANLIQFLNYKIDIWLINFYHHNKEMIGVYSLAVGLGQMLWLLPNAAHGVLYTYVSSEPEMKLKIAKTLTIFRYLFLYAIVGGIAGYFISVYVVPVWFGDSFAEVPFLIGILLFGIVPLSAGLALSAFFAGIHKIRVNLYGSAIGLLVCVLFNVFLIPEMGIKGAALSTVFSYCATILYYLIVFLQIKRNYSLVER